MPLNPSRRLQQRGACRGPQPRCIEEPASQDRTSGKGERWRSVARDDAERRGAHGPIRRPLLRQFLLYRDSLRWSPNCRDVGLFDFNVRQFFGSSTRPENVYRLHRQLVRQFDGSHMRDQQRRPLSNYGLGRFQQDRREYSPQIGGRFRRGGIVPALDRGVRRNFCGIRAFV